MLHRAAVEPRTLGVLDQLMQQPVLDDFVLVGGTALTLHLGHRISIDIDLFNQNQFDQDEVLISLKSLDSVKLVNRTGLGIHLIINQVETDIIYFPFEFIKPVVTSDGIRIASMEDIAAMKVSAIYKRGTKKDFYDLYFLLKLYSLKEILGFFAQKFPDYDIFGLARSLTYFEDAEITDPPKVIEDPVTWKEVKSTVIKAVQSYA